MLNKYVSNKNIHKFYSKKNVLMNDVQVFLKDFTLCVRKSRKQMTSAFRMKFFMKMRCELSKCLVNLIIVNMHSEI